MIVSPPEHKKNVTGSNVALLCEAKGFPIPTVEWTWMRVDGQMVYLPSESTSQHQASYRPIDCLVYLALYSSLSYNQPRVGCWLILCFTSCHFWTGQMKFVYSNACRLTFMNNRKFLDEILAISEKWLFLSWPCFYCTLSMITVLCSVWNNLSRFHILNSSGMIWYDIISQNTQY